MKAAGIEPRGELWAAMLDTKQSWDDLVLRHAKDEETAYRILENRLYHNLTARFVQSHDYIAMERLYEIHSERRVRPDHHRHPADAERDRLPRGPGPHGRLLRWPPAAVAHAAVPRRRQAREPRPQRREPALLPDGRPHPREQVPRRHRRVLPASSSRCTTASSQRANAVEQLLHDRRTTFAVVTTLEAAPLHEAERFCSELRRPQLPPRRARSQQDVARLPARARTARRRQPRSSTTRVRSARRSSGSTIRRSTTRLGSVACCARSGSRSGTSPWSRCGKRSCGSELARVPDVVVRVPNFEIDIGDVDGLAQIGRHLYDEDIGMNTVPDLARHPDRAQRRADLVQVERLVATWRSLADLSFSDLLLLAPISREEGHRFVVLAQVRPVTGQTNYPQDLVGSVIDEVERPLLTRAWRTGEIVEGDTVALGSKERVRVKCIPMRRGDHSIAVAHAGVADLVHATGGRPRTRLPRGLRPVRDHDRRGIVPVPGRRDRGRERSARRRRCDRHRPRHARALRQPERGELAPPHGHPHVRARPAARRCRLRRRRHAGRDGRTPARGRRARAGRGVRAHPGAPAARAAVRRSAP